MIGTFRKKPVVIHAACWPGSAAAATEVIDWVLQGGGTARYDDGDLDVGVPESIAIDTLEGTMRAVAGDYVIRGIEGEFYPCRPSIFEATYEFAYPTTPTTKENP